MLFCVVLALWSFLPSLLSAQPQILKNGIVNAASFASGPVAPGEIVTIFGLQMGPDRLVTLELGSDGLVSTSLGGTRVFFDDVPAPLIYAFSTQVSCVVPYRTSGRQTSRVEVEYQGVRSAIYEVRVQPAAPAIFSVNSSGWGDGAILNTDGNINSTWQPARVGSVVSIFCTGEGQTSPAGVDGKIARDDFPRPVLPVKVYIENQEAEVLYAGAAPAAVSGLFQVNARIPPGIIPVLPKVTVRVGDFLSRDSPPVWFHGFLPPSDCPAAPLAFNTTMSGRLAPGDCRHDQRGTGPYYTDAFELEGLKGDRVQFRLEAPLIAAALYQPPSERPVGFSSGSGGAISYIFGTSGKVRYEITQVEPAVAIDYTLTVLRLP